MRFDKEKYRAIKMCYSDQQVMSNFYRIAPAIWPCVISTVVVVYGDLLRECVCVCVCACVCEGEIAEGGIQYMHCTAFGDRR